MRYVLFNFSAVFEQLLLEGGRALFYFKIVRVSAFIGRKFCLQRFLVVVYAVFVCYHLSVELHRRFWLRECALDQMVVRWLWHHKLLHYVCSWTLALEKWLCIVDVVKKHLTVRLGTFLNVCVGLRLTVANIVGLFKCSVYFLGGYILVVLFQYWSFFASKIPSWRFSISENYCIGDRKFKYRIAWSIFCPKRIDQPL